MASAREIRRRIRTVKNIEQITAAMKMVASVQLRKAQQRVEAARPYAQQMQLLMNRLSAGAGDIEDPLMERREGNRLGLILFTADRGLCGSYNVNLIRRATEVLRGYEADDARLILVGRKGVQHFRRRNYSIAYTGDMRTDEVDQAEVRRVAETARSMFLNGEVDEVRLVYARFQSAISQRPTDIPLLPIVPPEEGDVEEGPELEYIFEPEPQVLLSHLLPRYVTTQVFQAMAEAAASEHGARMTSMSNATKNASEMIQRLTLALNRARQAGITKELAEIMGGVEALKG
ncbi:MAG: ATP synthase F1 subunit gamma [Armatimonadetes bacterium]|nr:ATP synthase F1 subunit gamma [Armatimonadota bacterium]